MSVELAPLVEDLVRVTNHYKPNSNRLSELRLVTVLPIVAPSCMGKSTTMSNVAEREGFTQAISFTTRPRREDEPAGAYAFRPHTREELSKIFGDVMAGSLVQCTVHPNGGVYGTDFKAYRPPYSLVDPLPSEIAKLQALRFRAVKPIALIAPPADYKTYVAERFANASEYTHGKMVREGISNLEWSLDQGEKLPWVINACDQQQATADAVVRIANGEFEPDPAGRQLGEAVLKQLRAWA